jgi:hypothetical protein
MTLSLNVPDVSIFNNQSKVAVKFQFYNKISAKSNKDDTLSANIQYSLIP